jgi:hypothetical protein
MLRFSTVFALLVIGLPAAAQQGQKDFPVIVPSDWSILPSGKSNEWRAVSPRRDAWLLSGYTADDRIFYRKTMLACEGRKWHNLAFEYPASDKRGNG